MSLSRRTLAALAGTAGLALAPASAGAIVGGTNAPAGKYPSVAKVEINRLFGCTGTLVAPRWVLTAGHCSSLTGSTGVATPGSFLPAAFTVTVNGIKRDASDAERVTVDKVVIPSEYNLTNGYDISLLRLAAPAKAAPTPVAGKGYEALWRPSVLTEIVGFGVTKEGGDAPPILQQASVPIVTDAACAAAYRSFEDATQICAGYPDGGTDTCQGDSGGPMFSRTGSALLVVGSTSYGDGCARRRTPGVYARVADATLRDGFIRKAAPDAVVDAPPASTPQTTSPGSETPGTTSTNAGGAQGASATSPAGASSSSPASGPATTSTRTGFRAALAVDRTLRRTVRARGLRFRLHCSAACAATVRLRVDAATTRRLGLVTRTVGTTTVSRDAAGRTTKVVKVSGRLKRKLRAAKGATFVVVATVREAPGGRASVLTARAVLRGR